MKAQADFGAGFVGCFVIPNDVFELRSWVTGPGAGGGAGSLLAPGGGGGSGASGYMCFTGMLGGKVLSINLPVGGDGGVAPGGNGRSAIGHATLMWDNGWTWIAGMGSGGYGGVDTPGPGGMGGNMAVLGNPPGYITSYGQHNLSSFCGMDGTVRLGGRGGHEGDAGGGGMGGWINTPGLPGQGGYIHLECH